MKSLILTQSGYAQGKPQANALADVSPFLRYGDLPEPEPTEGEVKIRIILASVNPSDEMFIQGYYGQPRIVDNSAGFEGVGEVVASGGGSVADGLVGLRVAFVAKPGKPGSWGEYSLADASTCIVLIDGVSDVDGAAMIVNPLTALAMFDLVKQQDSKSFILSAGASQLCKLMITVAAEEDYAPIAIVRRDSQIGPLKKLGAAHVFNCLDDGFSAGLNDVMRDEKPRVFLDAVANQTSAEIFNAMPGKSRWVVYGKLDEQLPTILQPGQLIFQSKCIEGFWLSRWLKETPLAQKIGVIQQVQKRFATGGWQTDVTAIVPMAEAMDRLAGELSKPDGKVFIKPD